MDGHFHQSRTAVPVNGGPLSMHGVDLCTVVLTGTLCLSINGNAGAFSLTEDDFFAPLPTVLSGARLVQPLADAPVAMTVIDREMIAASSVNDIAGLLSLVPGFQVTYSEGIEALTTYQGYADSFPRRMQVQVDGRSVYTPAYNGVIWSALPLTKDQIERIEVVRGPNAAAFGSNAFLGTINIITRTAETGDRAGLRVLAGSADASELELSHAGRLDRLSYRVTASTGKSDGFPVKDDDSKSEILNVQGSYRPTPNDHVAFAAGVRNTDLESEWYRVPRRRHYKSDFQQLVWEHSFSADEDVRIQAYHNGFDAPDEITATVIGLPATVDYTLYTHRYDVEVQHRWAPADNWRVSWGAGLRRDTAKGAGILNDPGTFERDVRRAFANLEWHARPGTVVNLGLMGEDFNDLGGFFSPRLALNQRLGERQTLRLGAARAYRMPTLLEQYGDVKVDILVTPMSPDASVSLGSEDIDAERIHSFELGYLWELTELRGTLDLRLFHNEVDRLIHDPVDTSLPAPEPRRLTNVGTLRTTGIEAQLDIRPSRDSRVHIAYAYTEADGARADRIDASGNQVANRDLFPADDAVPRHTLTAMGILDLPQSWRLSGTYYQVSEMDWLGEGGGVDAKHRVDARLSKRFRQADGELELSVKVHNLLNDPYWEFLTSKRSVAEDGNLSERRLFAELRYTYR